MFKVDKLNRGFHNLRYRAVRLLIMLIVTSFLLIYSLRFYEYAVTFHPERAASGNLWKIPKDGVDVWVNSQGGIRLHGWFISSQIKPAIATLIYFHGNGGNISHIGWLGESLSNRGFDVLLFDYRGYGRSEGDIRDERDLYADADSVYDYVLKASGASPDRIVLYGQSLGTTAVVDLASRKSCGAVILESALSSSSSMASVVLPWLPRWLHRFARNRFDSAKKLSNVHSPVLITHGDPDNIIPAEEGRKLYAIANQPKKMIIVPGADHNVFGYGGDWYLNEITSFIKMALAK